ncbi:hypothetical protein [Kitasatospora phosalacinea]|uniref:hypothetical protein n=1 Tax=Kitasatospora phosalacinea TaxID=2065 RepID=UPI0005265C6A|nr:hypothetical protein [Kitasatospora phosalacinea]
MNSSLRALQDQFIEWVYDHSDDNPLGDVNLEPFAEQHGLDLTESFQLLRHCKDVGLLDDRFTTMGQATANITQTGTAWVEERRRRRDDPAARAAAARRGLLTWLWHRKHEGTHMPTVAGVLEAPQSLFEGIQLADTEIDRAAGHLQAKGLIKGTSRAMGMAGPLRAEITVEGEDCVENYEADLAAYERRNNGASNTNFHIGTNTGNIAANSREVTQTATTNQGINPSELVLLARSLRQAAPVLGLPEGDAEEFTDIATRIENEASADNPDPGRLRRWGAAILDILNSPAVSGALAQTLSTTVQAAITPGG